MADPRGMGRGFAREGAAAIVGARDDRDVVLEAGGWSFVYPFTAFAAASAPRRAAAGLAGRAAAGVGPLLVDELVKLRLQ